VIGEEVGRLYLTLSRRPAGYQGRVERRDDGGQVPGRVGVRERPADRAAVPHRRVRDRLRGLCDQAAVRPDQLVAGEVVVRGERADLERLPGIPDAAQLTEAA